MGDRQTHDKILSLWFSTNSYHPYILGAKSLPLHFGRQEKTSFISRAFRYLLFLIVCITDVNHTTVYAQVVITYNGPKIRKSANTENTAMTTDLMVISYYKC